MKINTRRLKRALSAFALLFAFASAGRADTFTGTFTRDDEVRLINFAVATTAQVDIRTTSYAGGGFSPVLSLFDQAQGGLLIARNNGVDNSPSGDAFLLGQLPAGNYVLALTEYFNLAVGPTLAEGFLITNEPTFTAVFSPVGAPGPFIDPSGAQRTGAYAVDVVVAPIPEPATLLLAGTGLMGLARILRRRR